jgi:D-alanyl-D-alanine carboxypeptidase
MPAPLRRLAAPLGAGLLVTAVLASSAGAAPARGTATTALDRALNDLVAAPGGPPAAIAILHRPGRREVHRAGVAKVGGRAPRITDHMRLASTSKAFSGAVTLALVKRGRLHLGDTIGELLPSFPRSWHHITLAQALHHTSGLPSFTDNEDYLNRLRRNPTTPVRPRRLARFVFGDKLTFRPGTSYAYSNTDNVVAALMAEKATGLSYNVLLRRLVFRPAGLHQTRLPRGTFLKPPYIHGYDNTGAPPREDLSRVLASGLTWSSGGLVSTPRDLDVFARRYVRGFFTGRRLRRRQRRLVDGGSEPPGPGRNRAGLAIFRYRTRCGTVWGHTGNYPGYTQLFAATPGGRRSLTVSASEQLSPTEAPHVFRRLRAAEVTAVCALLRR